MNVGSNTMSKGKIKTNKMVKVSLLAAISYILTFIRIPLPLFPEYLKLDIAELPALIGGFSLGPVYGIMIVLIRNIVDFLTKTTTGGVGELSNFIVGSSFVITASLIYNYNKTRKTALISVICGTLVMSLLALLSNKYIIFPLYGLPADWGFLFTFIFPFNLIKGGVNSVVVLLIYKKISSLLKN
ncbi:MAG TPA: ECF transporter S component [Halanaerobiaceae bacterium]|jgi:riboflavin transporter FmnP|nr:ECF transporter S component [Bacillota bacterium]HHU91590.1 ECF transporter S component [Halanaerobiaceae bacterium]HOA40751.1 ECF transporter S component [Halanaerobiales bacterium]HPZ62253.1 ECF transporter S component [Halanaerobiales bacterium]HQD03591.1 ECF transporter S component [Halanaerobiales bacterium]